MILTAIFLCSTLTHFVRSVTHERNLVWAQKDVGSKMAVARIMGVSGNPREWVVNRTATTRYITAPNPTWQFEALAMDFHRQTLYWSDTGNKKIQGLKLDGSNTAFLAHSGCSSEVKGLAVDWTTSLIYWSDSLYNWILAASTKKQGALYAKIIDTDLDDPGGVAILPSKGLLFWTDAGRNPKVERSTCSGGERQAIVTTDLAHPTGLVLHPSEDILYFIDRGPGVIQSVSISGQDRKKLFTVENSQFFGIAFFEPFLFATDQADSQLYVFNLDTKEHEVNFRVNSRPFDVLMYDGDLQKLTNSVCDTASCDHLCANLPSNSFQCLCAPGYELQPDSTSCKPDGNYQSPQFIYSIGNALCHFPGNLADMALTNITLDTQCFLTQRGTALSLAVDVRSNLLFFAEDATKTISKLHLVPPGGSADTDAPHGGFVQGQSGPLEFIIGGTGTVEGLAVDWLTGNLYWTDSSLRHIMVSRLDGQFQRELINKHLEHPCAIVVDAVNRHLYWSDLGSGEGGHIEVSLLDGTERKVIVSGNMSEPRQLTIDYREQQLCWCDSALGTVECVSLVTEERKTFMQIPGSNIQGLTIFQDYLLWTDRDERNGIHAGIKRTGEKIRGVIHPGVGQAHGVLTFDRSVQPLQEDDPNPCSVNNGGCSQLCFPKPNGLFNCSCAMGFVMDLETSQCKADALSDHFAVFTDTYQKQIYQMALDSGEVRAIPLSSHENPIAVDYDSKEYRLYWTDVSAHVIKSAFLNGSEEVVFRQLSAAAVPDGLAIEPISRLLFYSDTGNKVIGVMTLTFKHHKVIHNQGLDQPRALALDPTRGLMFWTDWGLHSRIERSSMDGTNRVKIVDTGLGAWPNGLAIDILSGQLYWCDARADQIESSDLMGKSRTVLYSAPSTHFFGLAVTAGVIFYTDWTKKSVMTLTPAANGKMQSSTVGPALFSRLNDIHVFRSSHSLDAFHQTACSTENGGCLYICIPSPEGRTCHCPDGLDVGAAATCLKSKGFSATTIPTKVETTSDSEVTTLLTTKTHSTRSTTVTSTTLPTPTTKTTTKATTTIPTTLPSTTQTLPTTSPTTPTARTKPPRRTFKEPTTILTTVVYNFVDTFSPSSYGGDQFDVTSEEPDFPFRKQNKITINPQETYKNPPGTSTKSDVSQRTYPETYKETPTTSTTSAVTLIPWNMVTTVTTESSVTSTIKTTTTNSKPTAPSGRRPNIWTWPLKTPYKQEVSTTQLPTGTGTTTLTTTFEPDTTASNSNDTEVINKSKSPFGPLDDFGVSMVALMAIIIGGIVLMCLIIVSGIILYRKMDPDRSRGRRGEAALSSISDIYELPQTTGKHSAPANAPACRYAALQEQFYTGEMDTGIDNPSFSPRDLVNTYEEIVEESIRNPTFSTFR